MRTTLSWSSSLGMHQVGMSAFCAAATSKALPSRKRSPTLTASNHCRQKAGEAEGGACQRSNQPIHPQRQQRQQTQTLQGSCPELRPMQGPGVGATAGPGSSSEGGWCHRPVWGGSRAVCLPPQNVKGAGELGTGMGRAGRCFCYKFRSCFEGCEARQEFSQ